MQLANSKLARQIHSKAFNPTYTYPQTTEETSYNEAGFPIIAFGNMEEGTVRRDWVEYFFGMFPFLSFAFLPCECTWFGLYTEAD